MQEKKKQHLSAEKIHMIDSVANIADKVYKDKGKSEKKIDRSIRNILLSINEEKNIS